MGTESRREKYTGEQSGDSRKGENGTMAKVTIKDVAREAGVSISTVSNALNGVDVLKPETREHVLEVVDKLHYTPNLNGRNLKMKTTKVIGLFVTSLKGPYFAALADTIFWECKKYGYELNIFVTWEARSALNSILGRRVDGCVVLSNDVNDMGAEQIREQEIPTVFLDREFLGRKAASVIFDSYRDGEIVAEFMLSRGIRRICFVKGLVDNYDAIERFRGFREGLAKGGVEIEPEYILEGGFERECARESMKLFLEKKLPLPEAVFAANDLSAFGTMDALQEAGYRIPDDLMVVGVDDIELCCWFTPQLTTVKTGYEKQGVVAVEKLVNLINGEETGDITRLHGHLIERASTANVGNPQMEALS